MVGIKTFRRLSMPDILSRSDFFNLYFSRIPDDFFFVQIGANDGINHDPLHEYVTKYNLSGLVVEPQPDVFELLRQNYKHFKKVTCLNFAVGSTPGKLPFYTVKESTKTPQNFLSVTSLGSFNRDVLVRTLRKQMKNPEQHIQEIQVNTITFSELTKNVKKIDFLQIDCEGYDWEILKMVDFDKFSPSIINFENNHLSTQDRQASEELLTSKGYKFFKYNIDTCAYKV